MQRNFIQSLIHCREGALMARVLTPINADESLANAEERLKGFLKITLAELPDYLPKQGFANSILTGCRYRFRQS